MRESLVRRAQSRLNAYLKQLHQLAQINLGPLLYRLSCPSRVRANSRIRSLLHSRSHLCTHCNYSFSSTPPYTLPSPCSCPHVPQMCPEFSHFSPSRTLLHSHTTSLLPSSRTPPTRLSGTSHLATWVGTPGGTCTRSWGRCWRCSCHTARTGRNCRSRPWVPTRTPSTGGRIRATSCVGRVRCRPP